MNLRIKLAMYVDGRRIEDCTLDLEKWSEASGWRLYGRTRQEERIIQVEGRGSYGQQPGTMHPARLMLWWNIGVPTEKFLRERKILWGGGEWGACSFEGYDRFFPTLDAALAEIQPGMPLFLVGPGNPGEDRIVQIASVGRVLDAHAEFPIGMSIGNWFEIAKPATFKPVQLIRGENEAIEIRGSDGRSARGFDTKSDGAFLSEINGVKVESTHPECERIVRAALALPTEEGRAP
jgi:hypothetical protein